MKGIIRKPSSLDISRLILVGAIWGASFIFIALALTDFGPVSIAAWRIMLASIVLLIISRLIGQKLPRGFANWRFITGVGFLNSAIPFFLISWGQQFITSAESALLMATGTFSALLISHYTSLDERINLPRGVGVTVGFSGVIVLVVGELIESGLGGFSGQFAVMLAGVSYATSSVMARRITHLPAVSTSAATMVSACIYMVPMAFIFEQPFPTNMSVISLTSILYLGIIATALGFVIRFTIIRANGAVFMAQVGYLVPLFGVVWSWMFLSEIIGLETWIALILIVVGIAITRRGI